MRWFSGRCLARQARARSVLERSNTITAQGESYALKRALSVSPFPLRPNRIPTSLSHLPTPPLPPPERVPLFFLFFPSPSFFVWKSETKPHVQYLDAITRVWGDWTLFQRLLNVLRRVGDRHSGASIANIAVRWVLDHPFVGAVLVGKSKKNQISPFLSRFVSLMTSTSK